MAVPPDLRRETLLSIVILSGSIPFVIQTSGFSGVLSSYGRFRQLNAIRIPTGVLSYLAPWIVSRFDAGLPEVLSALAASRLISWGAHAAVCAATVPGSVTWWRIRREEAKDLLKIGGWMTVSNLVGPLLVSVDRFLVSSMVSLTAVAYYATPFDVVTRIWIIPGALTMALFPMFGILSTLDRERAALLHDRGVKAVCVVLFPLVSLLIAFAPEVLALWLGGDFAENASLPLRILAAGVFVNSLAHVPFALIQGVGRADLVAKLHLLELIPYLTIVVLLIHWGGGDRWCGIGVDDPGVAGRDRDVPFVAAPSVFDPDFLIGIRTPDRGFRHGFLAGHHPSIVARERRPVFRDRRAPSPVDLDCKPGTRRSKGRPRLDPALPGALTHGRSPGIANGMRDYSLRTEAALRVLRGRGNSLVPGPFRPVVCRSRKMGVPPMPLPGMRTGLAGSLADRRGPGDRIREVLHPLRRQGGDILPVVRQEGLPVCPGRIP